MCSFQKNQHFSDLDIREPKEILVFQVSQIPNFGLVLQGGGGVKILVLLSSVILYRESFWRAEGLLKKSNCIKVAGELLVPAL